jgi:hypothetical protein
MTRNKFLKLYGYGDEIKKEVLFADKVKEIVFVKFIYNKMLNMHRTLPQSYQMREIWSNSVKREWESIFNKGEGQSLSFCSLTIWRN